MADADAELESKDDVKQQDTEPASQDTSLTLDTTSSSPYQPLPHQTQVQMKEYLKDKCYLFYCPSMKELAIEMHQKSNGSIILGDIDWNHFNDGFPDLKIHKAFNLRWAHVAFLADLSDTTRIFEQYAIMCALPRHLARSVKIFVGYFPTGTYERVESYGSIATAKTLARLLSSIPTGAHGPVQICITDIHTLQNHFYFSDKILVRLETCTGLILEEMRAIKDCSVAFPDEGAWKRYGKIFGNYPQIICTKVRDGDKRVVQLKEGECEGRNVVIVDDLVQTGGTLAECAAICKAKGCASVSCFCTHSVFPKESWRRFCEGGKNEGLFERFYVSNTIPNIAAVLKDKKPFKVLSVASVYLPVIEDDVYVTSSAMTGVYM